VGGAVGGAVDGQGHVAQRAALGLSALAQRVTATQQVYILYLEGGSVGSVSASASAAPRLPDGSLRDSLGAFSGTVSGSGARRRRASGTPRRSGGWAPLETAGTTRRQRKTSSGSRGASCAALLGATRVLPSFCLPARAVPRGSLPPPSPPPPSPSPSPPLPPPPPPPIHHRQRHRHRHRHRHRRIAPTTDAAQRSAATHTNAEPATRHTRLDGQFVILNAISTLSGRFLEVRSPLHDTCVT
jgi:hypothetical protein